MFVRDASLVSVRSLVVLGAIIASFSCERETERAPTPRRPKPPPPPAVAMGGAPALPPGTFGESLGAAGHSSAGAANLPLGRRYAASLGNISGFTAASGKSVKVPYANELYDEQNQFDPAKSRFKAAAAQAYHVCASLAAPSKEYELSLYVNGARESLLANARSGVAQGCRTVKLRKADLLEVWVTQSTGNPVDFAPNDTSSWLTIDPLKEGTSLDSIEAFTAKPSAFTPVPFASELYDVDKRFDAKTKAFGAATPGDYRVCAALASPGDEFELDLALDGARENGIAVSHQGQASGCRTVRLAQGQHVSVMLHHASPKGPVQFVPKKYYNWLTIDRVPGYNLALDVSLDNSSAFSVPSGTPTKVPYVNKLYDDSNLFNVQTSRFVAPAPHDYRICAAAAPLAKDFQLDLYVNGTRDKTIAASQFGIGAGCRTVRLTKAGDFLEVFAVQTTGAPLSFDTNQFWNWMTVEPAHLP